MLETAERFTPEEKEPALRQFLLLVGGLRTLGAREHDPRLVLDAYLLRSLAVAGYAPSLEECAMCGTVLRGSAGAGAPQAAAPQAGAAQAGAAQAGGGQDAAAQAGAAQAGGSQDGAAQAGRGPDAPAADH